MTAELLPIGTRVHHSGHKSGVIVGYNQRAEIGADRIRQMAELGAQMQLPVLLPVDSFYDGARFPYIVRFDSGYTDVYAKSDLEAEQQPA